MRRYCWILTGIIFLSALSFGYAGELPSYFGFVLPVPDNMPYRFTPPSNPPYTTYERQVTMIIAINNSGVPEQVQPADSQDTRFAQYVEPYLRSVHFTPAAMNGKKTNARLPVIITFQPARKYPAFVFPVDSLGEIKDRGLYFYAYDLNNINPPKLVMFPKYFCNRKAIDSSSIYPFVLLKLQLDKEGKPTDVQKVRSTLPSYTQTTKSASLWAEYQPATVNNQPVASTCFLLVSYFPQLDYPTTPWIAERINSLSPLEQARVQLIPDTVGLMQKPLPRKLPGDVYQVINRRMFYHDTISAFIVVDSSEQVEIRRFSKLDKAHRQIIRDLKQQMLFYPAITYDGQPVSYGGLTNIIFISSGKIRIDYKW